MSARPSAAIVAAYLRERVEKELFAPVGKKPPRFNQNTLAAKIGVHRSSVNVFMKEQGDGGGVIVPGLIEIFADSYDDIHRKAAEWARSHGMEESAPRPAEPRVVRDEAYPNRGKAVAAAHLLGISEQAIRTIVGWKLKSNVDPSPEEWLEDIQAEAKRLKRGIVNHGGRVATQADEEEFRPGPPAGAKKK